MLNLTNLTITGYNATVSMAQYREDEFIRAFCSRLDMNILFFVAGFWLAFLVLQLLYRFHVIEDAVYLRFSQSLQLIYVMLGVVMLAYMLFRL